VTQDLHPAHFLSHAKNNAITVIQSTIVKSYPKKTPLVIRSNRRDSGTPRRQDALLRTDAPRYTKLRRSSRAALWRASGRRALILFFLNLDAAVHVLKKNGSN